MANESTAVFGGGCFWCTEAVFKELRGVHAVMPGYAGGDKDAPTYEEVSGGATGHAEVVRVTFDPTEISYRDLLEVFFATHDATALNRQGNDVGTQYRSLILYADDAQRRGAEAMMDELRREGAYGGAPIVTDLRPLERFYPAEEYHRDYYANNAQNPYCQVVIDPKLAKFRQKFREKLKKEEKG